MIPAISTKKEKKGFAYASIPMLHIAKWQLPELYLAILGGKNKGDIIAQIYPWEYINNDVTPPHLLLWLGIPGHVSEWAGWRECFSRMQWVQATYILTYILSQ